MTSEVPVELPLACSLSADELHTRRMENAALLAHAQRIEELAEGYRYVFPADAKRAQRLMAFILAEAACCPFFTFEPVFPSPHQAVWLTVRGRERDKEIKRASIHTEPSPTM